MESVKVSDDIHKKQNYHGAGWASAFQNRYHKFSMSAEISQGTACGQFSIPFVLTARQYGEVVLPDAASGHDPDTLARKLSRCKEGMAWFLQIQVQV